MSLQSEGQGKICNHTKKEEQYICVEQSCFKQSDFKLDCLKCLEVIHPHRECIEHIDNIIDEGKQKQKLLISNIEENISQCHQLRLKLAQNNEEMKKKIYQWIDQETQNLIEQIEKLEQSLNNHRYQIFKVQFTKDEIKNVVEFRHFDTLLFASQNKNAQKILKQNEQKLNSYFNIQFDRMKENYQCKEISNDDLPAVGYTFKISSNIQYEKCQEVGLDKTRICVEKTCLLQNAINLECPQCFVFRHCNENKLETHKEHFLSGVELQKLQNDYIEQFEKQCDEKSQEIEQISSQICQMITEQQIITEKKLQGFRQFVIEKEQLIQQFLKKFKQQYNKSKFVIYQELLVQTDFSILADVIQLQENLKNLQDNFTQGITKEKAFDQQQFQDIWQQGLCNIQQSNFSKQFEGFINPISKHIQELNNQICALEQTKKENTSEINRLSGIVEANKAQFNQFVFLLNQLSEKLQIIESLIQQESRTLNERISSSDKNKSALSNDILEKSDEILNILKQQPQLKQFIIRSMK